MADRSRCCPVELRERGVRMVLEHQHEYPSQRRCDACSPTRVDRTDHHENGGLNAILNGTPTAAWGYKSPGGSRCVPTAGL